jgi:hypothetical protein
MARQVTDAKGVPGEGNLVYELVHGERESFIGVYGGSVAARRVVAQGVLSAVVGLVGPRSSREHMIDRHRGAPQAGTNPHQLVLDVAAEVSASDSWRPNHVCVVVV